MGPDHDPNVFLLEVFCNLSRQDGEVVAATKDSWYILTELEKITDISQNVIEILNEKSHQELHVLAIRDRIDLVIEANKVITKKYLAQNVLDIAS